MCFDIFCVDCNHKRDTRQFLSENVIDKIVYRKMYIKILWCPIKMRVFHQNESCLSCPHPPLNYEGRREQGRQLSF